MQAKEGAKDWLEFLREQGHEIDKIPFYENAAGRLSSNDLQELAESEALVFSSAQSLLSICNQIEDEEKSVE